MPSLTNCYFFCLFYCPGGRSNRLACNVRMTIDFSEKAEDCLYQQSVWKCIRSWLRHRSLVRLTSRCWSGATVAALFNRTFTGLNVICFFMARHIRRCCRQPMLSSFWPTWQSTGSISVKGYDSQFSLHSYSFANSLLTPFYWPLLLHPLTPRFVQLPRSSTSGFACKIWSITNIYNGTLIDHAPFHIESTSCSRDFWRRMYYREPG